MYTCIELEIETGFANQLYCTFYVKKKNVFFQEWGRGKAPVKGVSEIKSGCASGLLDMSVLCVQQVPSWDGYE